MKAKKKTAKNKGGRPRKYKSPAEMQKAIDAYFEAPLKPTVTGLAFVLGFTSRADLIRYEGYSKEFYYALKRAKLRIEAYYEGHLVETNAAGSIFALKNFGWQDKYDMKHSVDDESMGRLLEILDGRSRGLPK